MTIAEVSKKYDISPDTLRYYERIGLIPPVPRSKSGIRDYGEDKFAKNIAKHICLSRKEKPIETTGELAEIIKHAIPMIRDSLDDMIGLLNDGGRICIITFHSLEDRIVKTIFRRNENPCTCPPDFPVCVCGKKSKGKVITRKPILPSEEELQNNSRSKSAKLRVFERVTG